MAKFFLTNQKEWYQNAKERIYQSDFNLAFDYAENGVFALTTHKYRLNNTNAVRDDNCNFAIATGTAIYKEALDYSVLIDDFDGNIRTIRDNTIGQYAYAIHKNNKITIFGDRLAAYDIFYYIDKKGHYFISNVLYDMAHIIREEITLNEMAVVEYASTFNIFCDETIFEGVYRLNGCKYIKIEYGKACVEDITDIIPFKINYDISVEEASKKLASILKYKSSVIAKVLGVPTILMTGGLDSRMSLAAYLSSGIKPFLYNGRSNTFLASPVPEDVIIIKKLAHNFSLRLDIVDWNTRNAEESWDKYLERYGFLSRHWGASKAIYEAFEGITTKVITGGLGGEMYRSNEFPTPNKQEPYTIDELTEAYGQFIYNTNFETYKNLPQYKEYISKKLSALASLYNIDINNIKSDDMIYFNYEFNKVGDTFPPNLLNQIRYAPYILLEADCVECALVTSRQLDGAKLMLKTMGILTPSILDVDFCTRCQMHKIDKETCMLVPYENAIDVHRTKLELQLKYIYKKTGTLLKPLRNLYKQVENVIRPKKKIDLDIKEVTYPSYISYQMQFVDPRPEFYYRMLLNAFDKLGFPTK